MADNTTVDNGTLTDYTVADDDDGTAKHQYVKVEFGGDGTQTKVTTTTGLPIQGTAGGTAVPVSDNGSTLSIDDGAGSITVDGTVTATVTGATISATVVGTGGATIAVGRASVTTTSGSAISANANRKMLQLRSLGTNTDIIDIGPSGVASGSGYPLAPGEALDIPFSGALHADAASGTQILAYVEISA